MSHENSNYATKVALHLILYTSFIIFIEQEPMIGDSYYTLILAERYWSMQDTQPQVFTSMHCQFISKWA